MRKLYPLFLSYLMDEFGWHVKERKISQRSIAHCALLIFDVHGEVEFNRWHVRTSLRNCEPGREVVVVKVRNCRMDTMLPALLADLQPPAAQKPPTEDSMRNSLAKLDTLIGFVDTHLSLHSNPAMQRAFVKHLRNPENMGVAAQFTIVPMCNTRKPTPAVARDILRLGATRAMVSKAPGIAQVTLLDRKPPCSAARTHAGTHTGIR